MIGTHALIEDRVEFDNLGLVIVDEQHRFGVMQRLKLMRKSGEGRRQTSTPGLVQPAGRRASSSPAPSPMYL